MHTFHGNFFVRSTDLLSLANINPDAGFAVQLSIEESLTDTSLVCFQTALLYTSSKGNIKRNEIEPAAVILPPFTCLGEWGERTNIQWKVMGFPSVNQIYVLFFFESLNGISFDLWKTCIPRIVCVW